LISPRLQNALLSRREACNSLFLASRLRNATLEENEFKNLFLSLLGLLDQVPREQEAALDDFVEHIFRAALDLSTGGYSVSTGRYQDFESSLVRLLKSAPVFVWSAPDRFIRNLFNALRMLGDAGAQITDWTDRMVSASGECSQEDVYLNAGFIAAWICGMAHFRNRALELCLLNPELVRSVFSFPVSRSDIEQMRMNPWSAPKDRSMPDNGLHGTHALRFRRFGGFLGFGGAFQQEPELVSAQDGIFAKDGARFFRIYADAFGAKLIRSEPETTAQDFSEIQTEFSVSHAVLRYPGGKTEIPELSHLKQFMQQRGTFYFTMNNSFYIFAGGTG